jgi:hypothetical protein
LQILEDRVIFRGLINNRALENLTQQEIRNAFAKVGLREAHNGHFISMLIERGPEFGINSLDDLARAMNRGTVRSGTTAGTVDIMLPNSTKVVANMDGELITFVPVK